MNADVIVAFADGKPVTRKRVIPPLNRLRGKHFAVVALIATLDADDNLKAHVADVMNLDEHAAQFVWDVLQVALKADPFLRSVHTAARIDSMVLDTALAISDATDEIFLTCTAQEETMKHPTTPGGHHETP